MKYHHFGVELAQQLGIHAAILFDHVAYWVLQNKEAGRNMRDGVAWQLTTPMALTVIYPYLSESQIKSALRKLQDAELIVNGGPVDTTKGRFNAYTLTERGAAIYYGS